MGYADAYQGQAGLGGGYAGAYGGPGGDGQTVPLTVDPTTQQLVPAPAGGAGMSLQQAASLFKAGYQLANSVAPEIGAAINSFGSEALGTAAQGAQSLTGIATNPIGAAVGYAAEQAALAMGATVAEAAAASAAAAGLAGGLGIVAGNAYAGYQMSKIHNDARGVGATVGADGTVSSTDPKQADMAGASTLYENAARGAGSAGAAPGSRFGNDDMSAHPFYLPAGSTTKIPTEFTTSGLDATFKQAGMSPDAARMATRNALASPANGGMAQDSGTLGWELTSGPGGHAVYDPNFYGVGGTGLSVAQSAHPTADIIGRQEQSTRDQQMDSGYIQGARSGPSVASIRTAMPDADEADEYARQHAQNVADDAAWAAGQRGKAAADGGSRADGGLTPAEQGLADQAWAYIDAGLGQGYGLDALSRAEKELAVKQALHDTMNGDGGPPRPGYATGGAIPEARAGGEVPSGSYIFPADVVAAMGDGSSEAGARAAYHRFGAIRVKGPGTGRSDDVPFRGSDGGGVDLSVDEVIVPPHQVEAHGGPDALDQHVLDTRADYRRHLGSLPGPKR